MWKGVRPFAANAFAISPLNSSNLTTLDKALKARKIRAANTNDPAVWKVFV